MNSNYASNVFLYIGSMVTCLGFLIIAIDHWDKYNYIERVGMSFVLGQILVSIGLTKLTSQFSNILIIFGIILSFIGFYVIDNNEQLFESNHHILIMSIGLTEFGLFQYITKKNIFTLFNVAFATVLFRLLTVEYEISIIGNNSYYHDIYETCNSIIIGFAYIILSKYLRNNNKPFCDLLNNCGLFIILNAGYFNYNLNIIFIIGYPLLLLFAITICLQTKTKTLLYVTILYIIAYLTERLGTVFKLNGETILIIVGCLIMCFGYFMIYYIKYK